MPCHLQHSGPEAAILCRLLGAIMLSVLVQHAACSSCALSGLTTGGPRTSSIGSLPGQNILQCCCMNANLFISWACFLSSLNVVQQPAHCLHAEAGILQPVFSTINPILCCRHHLEDIPAATGRPCCRCCGALTSSGVVITL